MNKFAIILTIINSVVLFVTWILLFNVFGLIDQLFDSTITISDGLIKVVEILKS